MYHSQKVVASQQSKRRQPKQFNPISPMKDAVRKNQITYLSAREYIVDGVHVRIRRHIQKVKIQSLAIQTAFLLALSKVQ